MKGNLWTLVIVIVLAAVLLPAAGIGFEGSTQTEDVEGETVTLSADEPTPLAHADDGDEFYNETVTHNSSELVEGTDYSWNASEGTIQAIDEQYDGEDVEIDYTYDIHDDEAATAAAVIGAFEPVWALLVFVVAVAAALGMTFAAWGGGRFGGR